MSSRNDDQIFVGDYTLNSVMRATIEKVNGVWQSACYSSHEGPGTGILALHFTPDGKLEKLINDVQLKRCHSEAITTSKKKAKAAK